MRGVDLNGNGEIEVSEAEAFDSLRVTYKNIYDLNWIEFFRIVQQLYVYANNLSRLDLSELKELKTLYASANKLVDVFNYNF